MVPIAQFRPLLEAIADAAWLSNPAGVVLAGNAPFARQIGLTPEQVFSGDGWDTTALVVQQLSATEVHLIDTARGLTWHLFAAATPLRGPGEAPGGLLHIARRLAAPIDEPLSRRMAALEAANNLLVEHVERLRLATRSAGIGVWEYRIATDELIWDAQMCALYGARPEDLTHTSRDWFERVHPDDRERAYSEAVPSRQGERDYETGFRVIWPDGSIHHLAAYAQVTRDAAGTPERVVGVNWDITALKRYQAELEQARDAAEAANRAKSSFLANMSHELRTPLNSILGRTELLRAEIYGPLNEAQQLALKSIEEGGAHLLALINDVLDLSRVEAEQQQLTLEPVEVEEVCQSALRLVSQSAWDKQLELGWATDGQVAVVPADGRRLKQILVNLLANAIKFTPAGGQVGLAVRGDLPGNTITFTVWDTGIGIAPEDLGRLFQPFVQLDSGLSRQYAGTGLGLALVRRLAEQHGGSVAIESQPGQGSRFSVTLPLGRPDQGSAR